jgi:hypothetical protein
MSRDRVLAADLWTREALVTCRRDTRLLFIALQNFADDHGVQPFRPWTIRLQAFPADADIDDAEVRAMVEELVSVRLARIYEVDGEQYVRLVDWVNLHGVPKRARRKYPADPSIPEPVPASASSRSVPAPAPAVAAERPAPEPSLPDEPPASAAPPERWRRLIKSMLRQYWPGHALIEQMDDAAADRWTAKWIAEGCDFNRDVVPVVRDFCALKPLCGPPGDFGELDERVVGNRAQREEAARTEGRSQEPSPGA